MLFYSCFVRALNCLKICERDCNRSFSIMNSLKMVTKLKWTIDTSRYVSFFFFNVIIHFVKEKSWKGRDVVKGYLKDGFSVGKG